jgi:hypothetical protein
VSAIPHQKMAQRKRRILTRLEQSGFGPEGGPVMAAGNIHYELAERSRGLIHGGIGLMHDFAKKIGLMDAIDSNLKLLKFHLPYHESDHVLNFAYNALCDGTCLDDIELRRNDEVFLDALGATRIPDPTTAGDFCRRFQIQDIQILQEIFDAIRLKVWARQPKDFLDVATLDSDGTMVPTEGECKGGMDINYKGIWGYHPLVVSLAQTGEVLRVVNRPGNRPSHEGASEQIDQAIALCKQAGFRLIVLRGDTDFSQTTHLDRWDAQGNVLFLFGLDNIANRQLIGDDLPATAWKRLERPPRYEVQTKPRGRWHNVKEDVVRERGYENIRLVSEDVAETTYQPVACQKAYRLIIVRKNLSVEKGQLQLRPDYRYFFYITNDWETPAEELVLEANQRCNQENLLAQLSGGVRSLTAPVDNLTSNWAYMVMTSLAWNLKAWFALWLPERPGRWTAKHREEKQTVLRMEFKTFLNAFIKLPCQLLRAGRKLVFRLLSWNKWQPVFFRMWADLRH